MTHPRSRVYDFTFSFLILTPFTSLLLPLTNILCPHNHLSADYFLDLPLLYEISCASNEELVGLCQLVTPRH